MTGNLIQVAAHRTRRLLAHAFDQCWSNASRKRVARERAGGMGVRVDGARVREAWAMWEQALHIAVLLTPSLSIKLGAFESITATLSDDRSYTL